MDWADREKISPHVMSRVTGREDKSTSATDEYHSLFKSAQISAVITQSSTSSQFRTHITKHCVLCMSYFQTHLQVFKHFDQ